MSLVLVMLMVLDPEWRRTKRGAMFMVPRALLECAGLVSPSSRCLCCLGTQVSSNQMCYFADVQKPPSENVLAVSFPSLTLCPAVREHCSIAGVWSLPLSVLTGFSLLLSSLMLLNLFCTATTAFLHLYQSPITIKKLPEIG